MVSLVLVLLGFLHRLRSAQHDPEFRSISLTAGTAWTQRPGHRGAAHPDDGASRWLTRANGS